MRYCIAIIFFFITACHKEQVMFADKPNDDFELPLLLRIDGKDCFMDIENSVLKFSILKEELIDFKAKIEFQEGAEVTFENLLLKNNQVNSFGTLEINKEYEVRIRKEGIEKEFSLIFTEIALFQLLMHDPIVNEPKTLAKLRVNYPSTGVPSTEDWLGVEHRGASSLKYDKKSIGFEAYTQKSNEGVRPIAFFDLAENSKWVLDAMYIDKAKMRNKYCFEIWEGIVRDRGQKQIEANFIELFINNEAYGLYALSQNYTPAFLELEVGARLYKGVESKATTSFIDFPNDKPKTSRWAGWEQVFPKPDESIDWDDFEELHRIISNSSDQEFLEKIGHLLDLQNVIDYYLFVNLFRASDSLAKNWFFLKRSNSEKFEILPWDLDASWGRNARGEVLDYETIISNGLFERLEKLNPANYVDRLNERWSELRPTVFSDDNLLKIMQGNFEELEGYQIIPYENLLWDRAIDLDEEKKYMEDWFAKRMEVLDAYFEN